MHFSNNCYWGCFAEAADILNLLLEFSTKRTLFMKMYVRLLGHLERNSLNMSIYRGGKYFDQRALKKMKHILFATYFLFVSCGTQYNLKWKNERELLKFAYI
jgi:hypothetical protein